MGIKYLLGAAGSKKWLVVRAMDRGARSAPSQKRSLPTDSELVELLWQNGGLVEHSQAQPHHHHHQQAFRRGPSSGNTGRSGVTGEAAAAPPPSLAWLPDGGGDMYAQLWRNIAQLEGRVDGDTAASAWPPGTSSAGSTRTGGEVGSSFCGSNAAPSLRVGGDAALPGASMSGRSGSSALLLKRAREDELDSRSEDADFDTVDEVDEVTPQSRRSASSKRRTRSAEVHNLSERRRRDRINDKMRALQELVPHCNKTDKASILDETIEYLKSLQMQVQIMWMTTGVVPMMLPGAHQLMSPMGMGLNSLPTTQVLSQMQRAPPFMNNLLPNQMPRVSSAATIIPNVANHVPKNRIAASRNPFLHPNDTLAAAPDELPTLFNYGSQMTNKNEMQELLSGAVAPALGPEDSSSSDGTGRT